MLDNFVTLRDNIPSIDSPSRQLFIDHLEFIRNHPSTQLSPVDLRYAYPEQHSFYGYCRLMGYEDIQYYPMMLLNGLSDGMAFTKDTDMLYIPSVDLLQKIIASASVE
jgi:hypothetical protein